MDFFLDVYKCCAFLFESVKVIYSFEEYYLFSQETK